MSVSSKIRLGGHPLSAQVSEKIDALVEATREAEQLPGIALAVVTDAGPAYLRGYGFADLATPTPMTGETILPIGSTCKGMTALAVMQLVDAGRVELDAPITRYLPFFATAEGPGEAITVRHLLTHTAGLPGGLPNDPAQDAGALERYVRSLAAVPLLYPPGHGYEYANADYATLGLLIQQVAGMPYEQYMAAYVFAPLGMDSTFFGPPPADAPGIAQNYLLRDGALVPAEPPYARAGNPAAMLLSSAADVARYLSALCAGGTGRSGPIIASASLREMWTPQVDTGEGWDYGLGWLCLDLAGLPVVAHTGAIVTSCSAFVLVPSRKLGVAVLCNRSSEAKTAIARAVTGLLLDAL